MKGNARTGDIILALYTFGRTGITIEHLAKSCGYSRKSVSTIIRSLRTEIVEYREGGRYVLTPHAKRVVRCIEAERRMANVLMRHANEVK